MMIRGIVFSGFWITICFGALAAPAQSGQKAPPADQVRFFESSIRPLLVDQCQKCHGVKKQEGNLRLDSRESILKGGDRGPAVVVDQPEKSLLIHAVRHTNKSLRMPNGGKKLGDRQIANLMRWVEMGAPYPQQENAAKTDEVKKKDWWAFKAPADPAVPKVRDTAWPQSPLDHFVLARLEAKGLKPAGRAVRRTLIRRATYDLLGLPPTPEEIDAFVNDQAPDAFAKLVDRLLASSHYGERWGRHWLDVARYADSNGLDENVAFGNAWRYRDYVVAALNNDMPYDQFLLEQLAGDLLPTEDAVVRQRRLIATGFLSLGPKVIAEVDEKKMEMDIVDEQIDTVGRSILALTLGCARCHDHKFDPVKIDDYYGLAGIFKSTKTMDSFKKVARWYENPIGSAEDIARKAEHDKEVARLKAQIKTLAAMKSDPADLKRLREELARLEKNEPVLPTALGVTEGRVVDVPIHKRGNHLKLGEIVPRHVPQVLAGSQPPAFNAQHSGRLELARWLVRPENPLTGRVVVNRIWRWHFGRGIVGTPDNFGILGELPDNPQLLDWLNHRFVEKGWSLKAMHRLVMLSSTYQMSSRQDAKSAEADPENRLHGRAFVRRLEAEAIRDALLAVSGALDKSMGGSLLHVKNRAYLFDHTSKDTTSYDSKRRSLYLPVIRNNVYDVFQLFDFPDPGFPSGDRATTTVAPQALFLLNSDWAMRLCDQLAESLLKDAKVLDAGRVRRLYRKAYGREATDNEVAKALALIDDVDRVLHKRETNAERRRLAAWSSLCQVVVSADEFIYVQ
jgi:cytochrome c553